MTLKALIVDDDEGMQLLMKKFIEKVDGYDVSGIASNGEAALKMVETIKPHVVFLDIEMPVLGGVECAKKIMDIDPKIKIIFATAYQEYMSEAFELYAFDYIVKPFKFERIQKTLIRIKEILNQPNEITSNNNKNTRNLDKIIIKNKDGISFVNLDEIIFIQRENRSTVVYTADERYITSEGLSEIEARLNKDLFFRSHKSYIINLSMIHKIYPYGRWTYIVKFKNTDKDALITYKQNEELQKMFM